MKAVFLLLFLLLGGALVGGYYFNELDYPAPEEKTITVAKGANIRSLAADLQAQGQIRSAWVLVVHGYQSGLSGRLQPGTYVYGRGMKAPEFLRAVSKGKALSYSLAVIEGRTFADLLASLRQHPQLVQTLGDRSPAEIAQLLKLPTNPEGLFLPATYSFKPGTSDVQLLRQMHQHLQDYLAKAWAQRDPNLPLKTPYEALILASLVEKETGVASERPQIAGVFIRRLQQKMKLQTDPSVIYGAADYQGVITKAHLQTDTPYNTYTRAGLPPTPIALASKASIEAVLHPAPGTALFFVADGSGGHKFSTTYEEHKAAVKAYRAWQQQRAKASTTPSPTVEGSASPTAPASPTAGPAATPAEGSASDRKATTAGPALRPGANPNAGSASAPNPNQPAPSATTRSASAPPAHQQAPTAGSASAQNANPTATSMPSTGPGVRPKATNQMSAGDASSQNDNPPANQIAPAGSASAPNAHQPAPSATSGSASPPNGNPTAHQTAPAGSASAPAMNQNASQTSSSSASAPNPNQPAPAPGSASAAAVKRTAKQVAGASAAPAIAPAEGSASVPTANATATPASSSRGAPLLLVPATDDATARIPTSAGHNLAPGPARAAPAPASLTASATVQLPNPPPPAGQQAPRPGPLQVPPPPSSADDPALPLQFASP